MICGIFDYPFLDYGKSACEEALLKALEYAALLPAPHIGVFDSLALNISADKLASIGDNFNAIAEYRHAILADRNNANAWNSLGVALAALGKDDEAIRHFITALRKTSDLPLKSKICYNLGVLFQNQKNLRASSSFFIRCLKLDPAHVFAWIRLGSNYEESENFTEAANAYEKAMAAAGGNPETTNTAQRYMARLEEKLNRTEDARILLHEALLRNPGDILAITALARSYLEEDPQMAELLARKSALAGDFDAWNVLAEALEAQGKEEEAKLARKIER